MSSLDRRILKIVTKIKRRMHRAYIIDKLVFFLSCACAAGILLVAASLLTPIYNVYYKAALIIAAASAAGIIAGLLKVPKVRTAALKADSLGLSERTVTAVELAGNESSIASLQKEDTLAHLEKLEYKRGIPLVARKRYLGILIILVMALVSSGFIYNPMNDKAAKIHELEKSKSGIVNQIDGMAKDSDNNPNLTEEQKKEIRDHLSELEKDIKSASNEEEISKALDKSSMGLEAKRQEQNQINEKLKKMAEDLGKAKSLSQEEKKALARDMAALADSIDNDPALKEALTEGAKDLENNGDMSELSKYLSNKAQDESLSKAMEELSKKLDDMKSQSDENKTGNKNGLGKAQPNGSQQSNVPKDGKTAPNNDKDGNDPGSIGGSDQQNAQDMGLNKKESSVKKTGEYEKIFTPSMLGGEGKQSQLNGKQNKSGSTETVESGTDATKGESVSYDRVYGQYLEQAYEGMDSADMPEGLKEIVRDYFTSLDE
jgi:hypothetical protein